MAWDLDPQQVEIIGRNWLVGELVRAGLEVADLGQLELRVVGRGSTVGILRHGGPLLVELLGGCPTPTTRQVSGGDRHLNFHGDRDNLWRPAARVSRAVT
jgi:hypothetical protein